MEGLIKGGLSLLVYFLIYTFFIRKAKKPSPKPPATPRLTKAVPLLSIIKEPIKRERKTLLAEIPKVNPIYVPSNGKSRISTLIRGQSKRNAVLLSEVLKNPYL